MMMVCNVDDVLDGSDVIVVADDEGNEDDSDDNGAKDDGDGSAAMIRF